MGSVEEEAEEGEEAAGTGDETKQNEETSTTEWRPVKSGNDTYYLNNTGETSWNLPTCPEDIVDEKQTKSGGDFKSAKALHLHNMYTVDGERRLDTDTDTDTTDIDGVSMVVLTGTSTAESRELPRSDANGRPPSSPTTTTAPPQRGRIPPASSSTSPRSSGGGSVLLMAKAVTTKAKAMTKESLRHVQSKALEGRRRYYTQIPWTAFALVLVPAVGFCLFALIRLAVWGPCGEFRNASSVFKSIPVCLERTYPIFDLSETHTCACDVLFFDERIPVQPFPRSNATDDGEELRRTMKTSGASGYGNSWGTRNSSMWNDSFDHSLCTSRNHEMRRSMLKLLARGAKYTTVLFIDIACEQTIETLNLLLRNLKVSSFLSISTGHVFNSSSYLSASGGGGRGGIGDNAVNGSTTTDAAANNKTEIGIDFDALNHAIRLKPIGMYLRGLKGAAKYLPGWFQSTADSMRSMELMDLGLTSEDFARATRGKVQVELATLTLKHNWVSSL
jgi:hypothetical protein